MFLGEFGYSTVQGDAGIAGYGLGDVGYVASSPYIPDSRIDSTRWAINGRLGLRHVVASPSAVVLSVLGLVGAGYSGADLDVYRVNSDDEIEVTTVNTTGVTVEGAVGLSADLALTDGLALRLALSGLRVRWFQSTTGGPPMARA